MRSSPIAFLLVLALAALAGGCDFFRPAEPEPPAEGSIIVPDYSHPDSTLAYLAIAIADKGRTNGATVYAGAFAESTSTSTPAYHQFFWPLDAAEWEGLGRAVPDWTRPLELAFYNQLINLRGDLYRLEWFEDPPNPDAPGSDRWVVHRRYRLTTTTVDGDFTTTVAVGYADLTLALGADGHWRIMIWQDRRDPEADPEDPDAVTLGRRRLNSSGV
jgi:hypothetical protein